MAKDVKSYFISSFLLGIFRERLYSSHHGGGDQGTISREAYR